MSRICFFLLLPAIACAAPAADWPAWRGPDRTGVSREKGLLKAWPKGGPKLLWTSEEAGVGYAGPAVVGDRLYLLGGDDKAESLLAFEVKTGKKLWSAEVGPFFDNDWGGGPRSTPTVEGDRVWVLAATGNLACLTTDGKPVWKVNLKDDLGGAVPYWGYSESPLIDGDLVVCTPGGAKGTLAALDKKTGKEVWRSEGWTDAADYASVVVATPHRARQYVQMAAGSVGGVDAKTGKPMWKFPREHRITVPTPVPFDNFVYVTSGYNVGANLLELTSPTDVKEVYADKNMVNHHGGVILLDGHIYGHSDSKGWLCQKVSDGSVVWQWRKHPKGSIVYVDGHFYCYAETDGSLALIEATTAGWKEKGRFKAPRESKFDRPARRPSANIWTHPVVANGRLYLRDQELLFCYDVKDPSAP
jgi:outer membrane protein assembly factor BamB